ncbi:hypothetical protein CAP36_00885 [Chitinophagaceae bacterium IBVUCB2]|nr:hypothetical protein CAP36_00885 [Chitinophagaceae bacterium IBVUCB2]
MNHFTIKDIENLCDIKAHTLRIWEQRYELFTPKRKKSLHRIYDNEDLKELLRISFLYHSGHKISKIAALTPEEIQQLVEKSSLQKNNQEAYVHQLIEAGIDFDQEKFEQIINSVIQQVGLERCIIELFYPFLQRIGLLWMTNNVIPAQEHFSSHIICKKIIMAIDGLKNIDENLPAILVFTPAGEFHEIPLLAANYFLRKYNNRTVYFGINVQQQSVEYYLQHQPVSCVYTHVITKLTEDGTENYINWLCKKFPDKNITLSGPAGKCIEQIPPNLRIIRSVDEMITFAKKRGEEYKLST